jgi:ribosome biogenesis GTPase
LSAAARTLIQGQVIAAYSRRYTVETPDGTQSCIVKGRKQSVVCGDTVEISVGRDGGVIESVLPRRTLLYRSDAFKTKALAANVTQLAVVVAARPSFSLELVQRCLLAAEDQGIACLLVLNKIDLAEADAARAQLAHLARLGYPQVELSAKRDPAPLAARMAGHTTVLVGQSGMGKSTLVNALFPDAAAATADYSTALDAGKHTTTHTRLYRRGDAALIDSPGLQEFALQHLDSAALAHAFVDFRPYLGQCRFRDCRHDAEPDCRLHAAVDAGEIAAARLELFLTLDRAQRGAAAKH